MKCPCHSGKLYAACCAPFHQGKSPPDALHLMRSRYSAYALNFVDYIIKTTHPNHPDNQLPIEKRKKKIKEFSQKTRFEGLEIIHFIETPPTAEVTFRAILSQNGKEASFTEKSHFILKDGSWLYEKPLTIN